MELLEGPFVEAGHAPVGKAVSYFFEYLDNWKSGWLVDHGGKCYLVVAHACHGPSGVNWGRARWSGRTVKGHFSPGHALKCLHWAELTYGHQCHACCTTMRHTGFG